MTDGNETASPVYVRENGELVSQGGLTKRETFAAMLLQGYLSSGRKFTVHKGVEVTAAHAAILMADELIKELNKESK